MYSVVMTHCSNPATADQLVHLFRGCGARCCASAVQVPTLTTSTTAVASGAAGSGVLTTMSSQTTPCFSGVSSSSSHPRDPVSSPVDRSNSAESNSTSKPSNSHREGIMATHIVCTCTHLLQSHDHARYDRLRWCVQ